MTIYTDLRTAVSQTDTVLDAYRSISRGKAANNYHSAFSTTPWADYTALLETTSAARTQQGHFVQTYYFLEGSNATTRPDDVYELPHPSAAPSAQDTFTDDALFFLPLVKRDSIRFRLSVLAVGATNMEIHAVIISATSGAFIGVDVPYSQTAATQTSQSINLRDGEREVVEFNIGELAQGTTSNDLSVIAIGNTDDASLSETGAVAIGKLEVWEG